jgi:hypothetical protein
MTSDVVFAVPAAGSQKDTGIDFIAAKDVFKDLSCRLRSTEDFKGLNQEVVEREFLAPIAELASAATRSASLSCRRILGSCIEILSTTLSATQRGTLDDDIIWERSQVAVYNVLSYFALLEKFPEFAKAEVQPGREGFFPGLYSTITDSSKLVSAYENRLNNPVPVAPSEGWYSHFAKISFE